MTTRTVSPAEAKRVLNELQDRLGETEGLAEVYARALLEQAIRAASNRPTPQAPMAAESMGVQEATILSLTGGDPSAVAAGSEFGSDIYPQFQRPHSSGGYWLFPSAENPDADTIGAGQGWLDDEIAAAVRRGI